MPFENVSLWHPLYCLGLCPENTILLALAKRNGEGGNNYTLTTISSSGMPHRRVGRQDIGRFWILAFWGGVGKIYRDASRCCPTTPMRNKFRATAFGHGSGGSFCRTKRKILPIFLDQSYFPVSGVPKCGPFEGQKAGLDDVSADFRAAQA